MRNGKLDILYLVPSFIVGGAEMQLLYLARGLNKQFFNPCVATFYPGGALRAQFERCPGVKVICFNKRNALDLFYLRRLFRFVQNNRFDIIQLHNTSAKAIGMLAAYWGHIPCTIVTERSASELPTSIGSRIYRHVEKRLIRRASVLVANSHAGAQFLERKGVNRQKIRVIYNGLDSERLHITRSGDQMRQELNIGPEDPIAGIIGSLKIEKDHNTFLMAAREVVREFPHGKFLIIGDGPRRLELQEFVRTLGLTKSVVFTGHRNDVANFVNILDLLVLTSSKTEGCSNAILEAMALAKPVVATRVGGNMELVQDHRTGFLIEPGDAIALAKNIIALLKDANLIKVLGRTARENIQTNFTLEQMVQQYQSLYQQIFSRAQIRP